MKINKYWKRQTNGRFAEKKSPLREKVAIAMFAGVIGLMIFIAGAGTGAANGVHAESVNQEIVNPMPEKIEALREDLVDRLAKQCETPGLTENDAPIILDTNNKMSIGPLMFQITTVQHYYKTLYGKTITRKEAVLIALDEKQAKSLAMDIIFKAGGLESNWTNCAKSLNLSAEVKVLNKLN